MFNAGPSSRRDMMSLAVMSALALGILVYWAFGRAKRRIDRDAEASRGKTVETLTVTDENPFKRKVLDYRKREAARPAASRLR